MIDLRQTKNYARYMELLGWDVEKILSVYIYIKKIPLFGSVIKVQRPHEYFPIRAIIHLAKEKKGRVAYIEPANSEFVGYFKSQFFHSSQLPAISAKSTNV